MRNLWIEDFFYVFILFIPFTYIAIVPDPAHTPVYLWVSFAMLFFVILYKVDHKNIKQNRAFFWIITGVLIIALISLILVSFNSESTLEFFRILFFWLSYNFFIRYSKYLLFIPISIITIGFLFMTFGYIDYLNCFNSNDMYQGLYDIRAHIGHKNLCSIFLNLTFPIIFFQFWDRNYTKFKPLFLAYIAAGIFLIILFKSRVGLLGLIMNIGASFIYLFYKKKLSYRATFLICLIFLSFVTYVYMIKKSDASSLAHRLEKTFLFSKEKDKDNQSVSERLTLWSSTIKLIKDYPLIGCGLGQWKLFIPSKGIADTRIKFGNIIFLQPHNDFLWVFSEYGAVGGILYLMIFLYPIFYIIKYGNRDLEDYSIVVFLLVFVGSSFFDFPKERPIFMFVLAYILARFSIKYSSPSQLRVRGLKYLIFFCVVFFFKRVLAEIQMSELVKRRALSEYNEVILSAKNIKKLSVNYDHTSTPLDFFIGEAYFFKGKLDSSIYFLNLAVRNSPYHLYSWNNLGSAYRKNNEDLKAVFAWEKAKEIAPNFADSRINLAEYYISKNNYQMAENQLHFHIENEVIEHNKLIFSQLIDKFVYHNQTEIANNLYLMEIEKILKDERRKLWLLRQFSEDSLEFKTQLIYDIQYSLAHKK